VVRDVSLHAQDNDLILVYPNYNWTVFSYYRERTDMKQAPVSYADTGKELGLPTDLEDHDRVWIVHDHSAPNKGFSDSPLGGSYAPACHERYEGGQGLDLTLYEKK